MKSYARFWAITAAALAIAACDQPVTEPAAVPQGTVMSNGAERIVEDIRYDFDDGIWGVFCEDGRESELIQVSGTVFERFSLVLMPSGGYHASIQVRSSGLVGTGLETGAAYRITERGHTIANQTTMREGGMYNTRFRVESMELGKSFNLRVQGNYAVNANGELIVSRETLTEQCEL